MALPKALKESVFVYLSFGLAVVYSIFAVLFLSSWISEYNVFFAIAAALYLAVYLTLIRLGTFENPAQEYLYLFGVICFLMPVVYGIGQNDPLLIRENLSSVHFFIFFAGIITSLKIVGQKLFKSIPTAPQAESSHEPKAFRGKLIQGEVLSQDVILNGNSAVFKNSDVYGVSGLLFYPDGSPVPAGAELVAPAVVDLALAEVGHKVETAYDYYAYMQNILSSVKALAQRYMFLLLLSFAGVVTLLLFHFPYQTPGRISHWFQLLGSGLFMLYLFQQFRLLLGLCLLAADSLYKNGCQISAFEKFLELLAKNKIFTFKISKQAQHKILADVRIIDEQVDANKLYELLFYLIADSRNSDFVQIRSHLNIKEVNPAHLNIVQRRIETPYGIIAWMDNKKLILGNEAFIIQNGVFVNASEFLCFENSDNIYFAIDQELLAGFILQKFSKSHLQLYADKLSKNIKIMIEADKQEVVEKNLGSYGLSVKSASLPSARQLNTVVTNSFTMIFSQSVFAASEVADAYLPAASWSSLSRFFSLYEKSRNLLYLNVAILALIFLLILAVGHMLLLAQLFVLITAFFLFGLILQYRYLLSRP